MTERVAVLGGGAVGVTAAHDLASAGADVVLYERGDLASGASGRAAGVVYDAFAEDVDAAVADRAMARFRDLAAEGAVEFADRPYVWFARAGDDRRAAAVRESAERMRANDRDVELLAGTELRTRFPALADVDAEAAAVAHDAGSVETASYVRAMAERARATGAAVREGTPVTLADDGTTVELPSGNTRTFDAVLVAAGAHSKRVLADAGIAIPMKPYRVQALITEAVPDPGPMCYDATRGRYARPHGDRLLVGDGTEEREFDPDDYDQAADATFEMASCAWVEATYGTATAVERSWAGLCTATPDRNPLVGRVADDRSVSVATGFHGHGFMRAPALGERIAAEILGGSGVEGFDPRRFDGDESFEIVEGMTVGE